MNATWIYNKLEKPSEELTDYVDSEIFAEILQNRGIENLEQAKQFLEPEKYYKEISPSAFCDMPKVVERISKAIATDEKIVVFGDFDADGVTATSLVYKTLKHLGAKIDFYVPSRLEESHGLNTAALVKLKAKSKMGLLITVDCGISNVKEVGVLKGLGVDAILTDHHESSKDLPDAFAILNPKARGSLRDNLSAKEIESLNYLAGVGVAYKMAQALLEKYGKKDFEKELLPLVAIGTIADVVPLLEENRLLIKKGIECIKNYKPMGIKALMDVAGYSIEGFDAQSIAFGIAPRINAIGRLEHASQVVELLVTEKAPQAEVIAKYMDDCNKIRQGLCENIFEEAVEKIEKECDLAKNKAIILADNTWHIGIIGIVASKLCEKYYRPVLILRIDEENQKIRCSARSIKGLHLYETFCEARNMLEVFGGHALAAGFSADVENLEPLVQKFHEVINENLAEEFLVPRIELDKDLESSDLSVDFVQKLQMLEPCGEKNPAPLFSLKKLKITNMNTIGSNSNHLKIFFNNDLEGIFWGRSDIDVQMADEIDVVFSPQINNFRNKTSVQLVLRGYKSDKKNDSKMSVKFVDHTKKDNAFELFLNYLKTTKTSISIFAEQKETIELLANENLQKASLINRLNAENVDQVVFLDLPLDNDIFQDVISKTQAKVVHFIGQKVFSKDPSDILKTFCGMLKYADKNLSGEVDLKALASKLYLSSSTAKTCLNLLDKSEVIKILEDNNQYYKVKFLHSKDLTYIKSFDEYLDLVDELNTPSQFNFS